MDDSVELERLRTTLLAVGRIHQVPDGASVLLGERAARGVMLYVSWRCERRAGLVKDGIPAGVSDAITRRIVVAQTLYAVGAALSVIDTYWSIGFIVAVQLNHSLAPRIPLLSRLTT